MHRVLEWGRRDSDAAIALAVAVGTRLGLFAVVGAASAWLPHARLPARVLGSGADTFHGLLGHLVTPWAHWDGAWYARIAADGYVQPHSPAFFPLYPLLMRGATYVTGGSYVIAGIVVSLVCYGAAMVVLFRLVTRLYDTRVAALTVSLISLFPASLYYQAVYSESLFLLTIVCAFSFALEGRWVPACVAGGLAALTRNLGVLLAVPLVLIYAQQAGWSLRGVRLRWPRDVRLAWLALVPLGSVLYVAFLGATTGSPLAFVTAEKYWHRELTFPPLAVWDGMVRGLRSLHPLLFHGWPAALHGLVPGQALLDHLTMYALPALVLVLAVAALVWGWKRLALPLAVFALLLVVAPLFMPRPGRELYSYVRFVAPVFPLFVIGALWLRGRRTLLLLTCLLSAAILCAMAASFAVSGDIP